jgi:hypothetical protein
MEKIYSTNPSARKLTRASKETVQFLLNYSKSLRIVEYGNIKFENILN